MILVFDGEIIHWRGPAPWFFVQMPEAESQIIKMIASQVSYGWGVIPVIIRIGKTEFTTSLFPKADIYLVPVKVAVRKAEKIDEGDIVTVELEIKD